MPIPVRLDPCGSGQNSALPSRRPAKASPACLQSSSARTILQSLRVRMHREPDTTNAASVKPAAPSSNVWVIPRPCGLSARPHWCRRSGRPSVGYRILFELSSRSSASRHRDLHDKCIGPPARGPVSAGFEMGRHKLAMPGHGTIGYRLPASPPRPRRALLSQPRRSPPAPNALVGHGVPSGISRQYRRRAADDRT